MSHMYVASLDTREPFTTLDGSSIRELAGPSTSPAVNQSLAEATIPVGGATQAHFHVRTEELYFLTAGRGRMQVGDEERDVTVGDCTVIAPGEHHKIWNTGTEPLVLLCCCAPAHSHEDTVLLEGDSRADTRPTPA